jgi:hypothetical protein
MDEEFRNLRERWAGGVVLWIEVFSTVFFRFSVPSLFPHLFPRNIEFQLSGADNYAFLS